MYAGIHGIDVPHDCTVSSLSEKIQMLILVNCQITTDKIQPLMGQKEVFPCSLNSNRSIYCEVSLVSFIHVQNLATQN